MNIEYFNLKYVSRSSWNRMIESAIRTCNGDRIAIARVVNIIDNAESEYLSKFAEIVSTHQAIPVLFFER